MIETEKRRFHLRGIRWTNLLATAAALLVLHLGEDMAAGIPAPGNLSLGLIPKYVLIFWVVNLAFDRLVKRSPKPVQRFRGLAVIVLLFGVIFFVLTWSTARELVHSGMPLGLALQRTSLWLICGVAALAAGIGQFYCAWLTSERDAREHLSSIGQPMTRDERDEEVMKRSAQAAFMVSMLLFFLVLPLVELFVWHRYPVFSLLVGGLIGLSWMIAYLYWYYRL
ncbi:MAG: hypothetical protein ACOX18_04990 [Bacillota bacterium]|jgi:hypothetical protein